MSSVPRPYFCRVEYWNGAAWMRGHAGINLLDPERYAARLAGRGTVARVTVVDTGDTFGAEGGWCGFCDENHPGPFEGKCLL